jgi:septal ring factor EnvC (AmiA/AmiB activator)
LALVIRAALTVFGAGLVLIVGVPLASSAESSSARLEELREAIRESRKRVESHEREERATFDRLEEISRSLALLTEAVAVARSGAADARAELGDAEARVEVVAERLDASRAALSRRAVALYKAGGAGPLQVLFSATSLRDFLSRVSILKALVEHDAELVNRHREDYASFSSAQQRAGDALAWHTDAAEQLRVQQSELASERAARSELLARVRKDRHQERSMLVELERAAQALEETLAALGDRAAEEHQPFEGAGFDQRKGGLALPVQAAISQRFGRVVDEQYSTRTFRKGVEFDAPIGVEVVSVGEGEVRFAGWFRGYGKIVIVDHGDRYFTVSGHLSEIRVEIGATVREGQVLGEVGETGTLSGPSLYFELRQGSEPLNPADWFASR